jgi:hypothetical protein
MSAKRFPDSRRWSRWWLAAVLITAAGEMPRASAQTAPAAGTTDPAPTSAATPAAAPTATPVVDPNVVQAGCSACTSLGPPPSTLACQTCNGEGCLPGRYDCCGCWNATTCVGRFFEGFYECLCCPDPCYVPRWLAVADSAFFVDAARPVTQMKLTWDSGFGLKDPDRAEFFWAREKTNPVQYQAGNCMKTPTPKGPSCIASEVDHEDLALTMEAAAGHFGFFITQPYREVDPSTAYGVSAALGMQSCCPFSGFADMTIGTKSMLLDCQLLQLTFEFKTTVPTGNFTHGLGTGHVSLEPSLLLDVCLARDTYLESQFAYWIPVGGDPYYEAPIYHTHLSFNRVLWRPIPNIQVVGTAEINEWTILGGAYTSPDVLLTPPTVSKTGPVALAAGTTMASLGPGVRLFICDKIDIGVGTAFAVTGSRWEEELIRAEFRWRF